MFKRYFVKTDDLREGMRIDQAIKDRLDRVLISKYAILDAYMIDSLKKLGIRGVYISEGEEPRAPEQPEKPINALARNNISKLRTEDAAKVNLSESVKRRVSEGIQFLYNNSSSQQFVDTANNITNNLMKAINNNDALAVDITALKTSDEYTFKHSVDVATIAMIIAKKQGFKQDDIYNIGIAGLLHDMGKSKIPSEILNKPGKLNDEEFAVMKKHSELGYEILKEKNSFSPAIALAVLQHHEKINGSGYPMGVKEDKIIPYAKILSVSDVYDALVTERPYKKAYSQRTAVEMIMTMTAELDLVAMQSFLSSVILYPVDSTVQLSNGERARVVKNNPETALRPTVVGLDTGNVYELAEIRYANIVIL